MPLPRIVMRLREECRHALQALIAKLSDRATECADQMLVMRNAAWPSHSTSICCASAAVANSQSATASAVAVSFLPAIDIFDPSLARRARSNKA